ncbi:MAG: translation initiation factor IF-2 [Lachnospiraceae bacterium]|nr:translation initiation factor IF-2 [Lachnospiraceae bacterium]
MAKMRIYELARELVEKGLAKDSKTLNTDIINFLSKNGVEVKSHQSGVSDEDADKVRDFYSKKNSTTKPEKKEKPKAEAKPEVKPEKKPETKPEAKSEIKAEAKPEVKAEAKPEVKPAPEKKPEKAPERAPERRPEGKPEGKKRAPVGKLIGKDGRETPYWIAKDGRLVGMDNKPLPLKLNENGKIVKLDGSPLQKRPATPIPADKQGNTKNIGTDISKAATAATQNAPEPPKAEEVKTPAAPVEEKAAEPQKPESNEPQPRIVGNIFESLAAAKDKEQAMKEKRAAQEKQGRPDRPERSGEKRPFDPNRQGARPDRRDGRPEGRPGERRDSRDMQGDRRPAGDGSHRPPFRDKNAQGQPGGRPFGDRDKFQGGQKPFDRRGGMGGPAGFGDKDKDDDVRKPFATKRPSKPSPDGKLKSELGAQVDKNERAGKYKNKGKDKKDKRDYDDENVNLKKDPNRKGAFQKPVKQAVKEEEDIKVITIPEVITIKELADKMKQNAGAIVKKLFLAGKMINQNSEITFEEAEEIALDYEIMCEKEAKVNVVEELLKETEEDPSTLIKRPPVVCVMGHVDHGKTSLLDAIRSTNVTSHEAGGITQHIGAYMVEINGEKITFLDTPGHEAFTSMRMRGAKSTDIAILVVAADDGVMPQTIEAINHAKAANVSIIVAVNKIDKPGANIEKVKQELTEYGLVSEDWGGDTVFVPVSAKTKEGIENLLEMVLLTADVLELKANPNRKARGIVIEAERDRGKGCIATVLVQKGTLNVGDYVAIGASHGRIRAMIDDKGRRVKVATPSTPVEIQGLDEVPNAGEIMMAVADEKEARTIAEAFIAQSKEQKISETKARLSLDGLFSQIEAGNVKELNLIIKADVMGSVEAVKQSLIKLSNEEVVVRVIHGGVGNINESDVNLAGASNAIIIGFNVKPDNTAKDIAEHEGVEIKLYKVIYNAIDDIEAAMKGMLKPIYEEKIIAHAEVRQLFKASQIGIIAGSFVLDGKIERGCSARISREGKQIYDGPLSSLKRFKDDVKEVAAGYECGLVFEKFSDLAELDQIEFYKMVEVPRS